MNTNKHFNSTLSQINEPTRLHHLFKLIKTNSTITIHINLHNHPSTIIHHLPLFQPQRLQHRSQLLNRDKPVSILIKHIKRLHHILLILLVIHNLFIQDTKLVQIYTPVVVNVNFVDHANQVFIRDEYFHVF
ncbi:hypothetical protein Hanom_Chr03g00272281 [Helianthus anomalus]